MELVSSLPKPEGFFDPKQPGGEPTRAGDRRGAAARPTPRRRRRRPRRRRPRPRRKALPDAADVVLLLPAAVAAATRSNFANSDLAFSGNHLFMGNFHGFNTYDIENSRQPRLLASVVCPGGQGDVSVHGNLLFMSVEQTRGRIDCGTQGVPETASSERFRGVRIFDITDVNKPKQIAAVQTCRGSHTHTLVTDAERQGEHLRLRIGHRPACDRPRSWRSAPARIPRKIRTPRSSASM